MAVPDIRTTEPDHYADWRNDSLIGSWRHFSDDELTGKDVLDFGCGGGHLSFLFASKGLARSITGVDIDVEALERAKSTLNSKPQYAGRIRFIEGSVDGLPLDDASIDLITAFDCLEHVMEPAAILKDWERVLRPGGRVLLEWFPFKGPWGPHMEALIPLPWAHVVFGEKAMFHSAAEIYDDPDFVPRHWDIDKDGQKKPNKWRQWESFVEQAYVNELDIETFGDLVSQAGLKIDRLDKSGLGGGGLKKALGDTLMAIPVLGEYATSFAVIALQKP